MHSNVSSLLGIVLVAIAGLVSYGQTSKQPTTYTAVTVVGVADTAPGREDDVQAVSTAAQAAIATTDDRGRVMKRILGRPCSGSSAIL